jgi:hypothetical protein
VVDTLPARPAANVVWLDALIGSGLPEPLVERLVCVWSLPRMDITPMIAAMEGQNDAIRHLGSEEE